MARNASRALACIATVLQYGALLVAAVQTWPSSMDELEDIMFLNNGYRARNFAFEVTPCSFSSAGPGRIAAAEWLRTAFHDMATGSVYTGIGGLDGSLMYELGGDNIGAAFATTLSTYAPFLTSRSSLSDIIAMGVYTAVRTCGGLPVPIRTGRIDATAAGPPGVPLPQNSLYTFEQQFLRTGFNTTEMIAVTACGHTIGGVHAVNFPQIVPVGSAPPNDYVLFDSTTVFDEKIASQYVAGTETDPLDVGACVASARCSDVRVFAADGNVTMTALANPATFQSTCQTMLQKMIEVVPAGTVLTDPIVAYDIKPNALQLTLLDGGSNMTFSGEIRVRTTVRPASQILSVQLVYNDRTGGNACGSCTIGSTEAGTATGFDDSFSFYGFSAQIPTSSSISAFNVLVTLVGGGTELHNNNGGGFPVQDTIMLQSPQSCLNGNGLTVVAAVRNTQTTPSVSLNLTTTVSRGTGIPVPALQVTSVPMTQISTVGPYNIYTANTPLDQSRAVNYKFDVLIGSGASIVADSFKNTNDLFGTCSTLGSGGGSTTTSISSSTAAASSTAVSTSTTSVTSSTTTTHTTTSSTVTTTTSVTSSTPTTLTTTSSTVTTSSSTPKPTISGYTYQGCMVDNISGRVLTGKSTSTSTTTYASCAAFCAGYNYMGLEYSSECWCGNSYANPTSLAPDTDCSFPCSGSASEVCGAGNRLTMFQNNIQVPLPSNATIPGYGYSGCYTDGPNGRLLSAKSYANGASMSIEACAAFCAGYTYFGTEYADECYCGMGFAYATTKDAEADCNMVCSGNGTEICGAGNRLSVYQAGAP
ncbi:hypothetical protein MMC11_006068 [Xylographa trunciseda]|nr:hypothetical protein [Xylographa trunciseda]